MQLLLRRWSSCHLPVKWGGLCHIDWSAMVEVELVAALRGVADKYAKVECM